jgi:hypothetical protein
MLKLVVAFLAAAGLPLWSAGSAHESGVLTGTTQISFGCPGPVREGSPACNPWHTFPDAHFSVARRGTDGGPVTGTARVLTSDPAGHFRVRLGTGVYLVTPLPQAHTRGGTPTSVQIRASRTRTILVRFIGYPQML